MQTPVSCSGSDGAFMKNMRHDLDGSMRPPNPREESVEWRNHLDPLKSHVKIARFPLFQLFSD